MIMSGADSLLIGNQDSRDEEGKYQGGLRSSKRLNMRDYRLEPLENVPSY